MIPFKDYLTENWDRVKTEIKYNKVGNKIPRDTAEWILDNYK